jgi:hypothetical protein
MNMKKKQQTSNLGGLFQSTALEAKLGEIFGETPKQKNDWKKRMLKAGMEKHGLSFPDDFDDLPEEERGRRLDGAIEMLGQDYDKIGKDQEVN